MTLWNELNVHYTEGFGPFFHLLFQLIDLIMLVSYCFNLTAFLFNKIS